MSCCPPEKQTHEHVHTQRDWMFLICFSVVAVAYVAHLFMQQTEHSLTAHFTAAVFEIMNAMWWGVVMGIVAMGFLNRVPREFIISLLGRERGIRGILRATLAGVLLDLCSHGILMVGAKLYERGATLGQVMAFLLASPWNSLSLTFVLIALVGLKWTLVFIVLSMVVGIASGIIFDALVARGVLAANPNRQDIPVDFKFMPEAKKSLAKVRWTPKFLANVLREGAVESTMILRWMLLGVIIAALMRVLIDPAAYATYFGPTLLGLVITLGAATVIEVCSEGSTPIAADILSRAGAPGNSFTFLMAGVATDYTEMMILRQMTGRWKVSLFLPLVTVPQVLFIGYLLNTYGV